MKIDVLNSLIDVVSTVVKIAPFVALKKDTLIFADMLRVIGCVKIKEWEGVNFISSHFISTGHFSNFLQCSILEGLNINSVICLFSSKDMEVSGFDLGTDFIDLHVDQDYLSQQEKVDEVVSERCILDYTRDLYNNEGVNSTVLFLQDSSEEDGYVRVMGSGDFNRVLYVSLRERGAYFDDTKDFFIVPMHEDVSKVILRKEVKTTTLQVWCDAGYYGYDVRINIFDEFEISDVCEIFVFFRFRLSRIDVKSEDKFVLNKNILRCILSTLKKGVDFNRDFEGVRGIYTTPSVQTLAVLKNLKFKHISLKIQGGGRFELVTLLQDNRITLPPMYLVGGKDHGLVGASVGVEGVDKAKVSLLLNSYEHMLVMSLKIFLEDGVSAKEFILFGGIDYPQKSRDVFALFFKV